MFMSYKFVDSEGSLRDKVISTEPSKRAGKVTRFENSWFDGSSFGFCPTENSDLLLVPDSNSFHHDPIRKMDSVFCFLRKPDGSDLKADFRTQALKVQEQDEQTRGALFGVEPEFFILEETHDKEIIPFGESQHWTSDGIEQYKWYLLIIIIVVLVVVGWG